MSENIEYSQENEHMLIERARSDPRAFGELYDHYFPKVFRYISWRVGSKRDAEDLVSDVFMKALDKLTSFAPRKNATFSSWLFRIAHNTVVDYYRTHSRMKYVHIDDVPEIEDDTLLPDTLAERKEVFQRMRALIDILPDRQKEILTMRFFGEMRNKEIAQILGISEKSVASALTRSLAKLRKVIGEQ